MENVHGVHDITILQPMTGFIANRFDLVPEWLEYLSAIMLAAPGGGYGLQIAFTD